MSILNINLSISLEVNPKFNFLIDYLNSISEIVPFPSESNSLNICSSDCALDLMIYLIFSSISTSHVELDDVAEIIVVRAPGGAVLIFLTVEFPV